MFPVSQLSLFQTFRCIRIQDKSIFRRKKFIDYIVVTDSQFFSSGAVVDGLTICSNFLQLFYFLFMVWCQKYSWSSNRSQLINNVHNGDAFSGFRIRAQSSLNHLWEAGLKAYLTFIWGAALRYFRLVIDMYPSMLLHPSLVTWSLIIIDLILHPKIRKHLIGIVSVSSKISSFFIISLPLTSLCCLFSSIPVLLSLQSISRIK